MDQRRGRGAVLWEKGGTVSSQECSPSNWIPLGKGTGADRIREAPSFREISDFT